MADAIEPVTLRAGDLLLRPWTEADLADTARICSEPEIARWMPIPQPYTAADAATWLTRVRARAAAGSAQEWALTDAASGRLLGGIGLGGLDAAFPAIGVHVSAAAAGRGVATAATRAVCRWAFERGAPKVLWLAYVGNEASWRVAHRAGFVHEGRRRAELAGPDGERLDAWAAALLPAALDSEIAPLRFDPFTPLVDGEVSLRRWRATDVEAYVALRREPSITQWDPAPEEVTSATARAAILERDVEDWLLGVAAKLAVCLDDAAVGQVNVRTPAHTSGSGELGWTLASSARGRGVATRAVTLARDWAFGPLGLRRLEARMHAGNTASRALAERIGMSWEGRHRGEAPTSGGRYGDGLSYGMLASDVS